MKHLKRSKKMHRKSIVKLVLGGVRARGTFAVSFLSLLGSYGAWFVKPSAKIDLIWFVASCGAALVTLTILYGALRDSVEELGHSEELHLPEGLVSELGANYQILHRDQIYSEAIRLVRSASLEVRATSFGGSKDQQDPGSKDYLKELALVCTGEKDVRHTVIYGPGRESEIQERKDLFRTALWNLFIYSTDHDSGVDFLVVDNQHLHISFQDHSSPDLRVAIQIESEPSVVSKIVRWFDDQILSQQVSPEFLGRDDED